MSVLHFMHEVRALAVPRLRLEDDRVNAYAANLRWTEYTPPAGGIARITFMLRGYPPLGEAFYKSPTQADEVRLYTDSPWGGSPMQDPEVMVRPFGHLIAFTTIHELGHVISQCGHNCDRWQTVCREMGICETRYDRKTITGQFAFNDKGLQGAIYSLPSYPGDAAP